MRKVVLNVTIANRNGTKEYFKLEGDVTNITSNKIEAILFSIEYTLNEHLPIVRVHSSIEEN